MSYDSKLAQTGRRVANARRKYYGSFDYGSGIAARQRGGSFSFGRKFELGGEEDVYEPELEALMQAYWRKHPNDAYKFNKNPETGLSYGDEFSGSGFSGETNWGGLASLGMGMLGEGVQSFKSMSNKSKALNQKYDVFGTDVFSGITDNSAFLSRMSNTPLLSEATAKDFRNKTVGQDIMSALSTGVNATISSGGNYWVGLGAMALDAGKSVLERFNAKEKAREATLEAKRKNLQFLKDMSVAGQDVDARNDWMRMYGYFNDPFGYAFGGPLHSNGGDYNGGLTFIDEGGRHEDNPLEGVPSGVDENGNPNLVEEGEVIWNNDYVFSDRIQVPSELKEKYRLRGDNITFADAITKLTKENTVSPNDPITIATTKAIVGEFIEAQEAIRQQKQVAAKEELEAAQADDFLAQLDAAQGMAPQGMALPPMAGMPNEAPVTEGAMVPPGMALGGKKFDGGGWEDFFKMLEAYQGSLGASSAAGRYAIDRNAKYWNNRSAADIQKDANYQTFTKWVKEHKDDPNVVKYFEYLDKGINKSKGAKTLLKYDKDGKATGLANDWENTFEHRRTDNALGIYHLNPADIAFLNRKQPANVKVPNVALKDFDYNIPFDLDAYLAEPSSVSKADATTEKNKEQSAFKYRPTWQRNAPVLGSAMAALYGVLNTPDYYNADEVIKAARLAGTPVNIPVQTIGDYRRRNPYDERYLVNLANQNRAAAVRSMTNTAGGNRSVDMLGAMTLAHSGQYDLGEIMRQAYLANRTDDAQVAEFNRGTNVQNMNAINQRNLTQAQLNSQRQQAMLSGLERGYSMRQGIKDAWDSATMESLNSMLASLGAIGKENEEYNMLTSMAEQGYYPYYYGDKGVMQYARPARNGGKLNRKKRRF